MSLFDLCAEWREVSFGGEATPRQGESGRSKRRIA